MTVPTFTTETITQFPEAHRSDEITHMTAVGDVDQDGRTDILVCDHAGGPTVVRNTGSDWDFHQIDDTQDLFATGLYDLTGSGNLDIICASSYSDSTIYWWENPGSVDGEWIRRTVIDTGHDKFHDLLVTDLTGEDSIIFTNQCMGSKGATDIYRLPIPSDPTETPWPGLEQIASGNTGYNSVQDNHPAEEGLCIGDVDGDGEPELVAGTRWYDLVDGEWLEHRYTDQYIMTKIAIADMDADGMNEIVVSEADALIRGKWEGGRLGWFDPGDDPTTSWTEHRIDDGLYDPHTLQIADVTESDYPDVIAGEVGRTDDDDEYVARLPRINLYENHGDGTFRTHFIDQGTGIHDGLWLDLDEDGTEELVGKPVRAHQHHQLHQYRPEN